MHAPSALRFAEIGSRIREARGKVGLSQEAFAARINTSRRHVMRLERGQHMPSEPMLERIADVTGSTVEELVGDDDDEETSMTLDEFLLHRVRQMIRDELRGERGELVNA